MIWEREEISNVNLFNQIPNHTTKFLLDFLPSPQQFTDAHILDSFPPVCTSINASHFPFPHPFSLFFSYLFHFQITQ